MNVTTHRKEEKQGMANKATGKPDSEAKKAWMKQNTTVVTVKLMHKGDADIMAYLEDKSKATVIKQALRLLMEQEGFEYVPPEPEEDDEE